jgi:hypothetical protein
MEIRFTQSARKHRIGKTHAKFVIQNYESMFIPGDSMIADKRIWIGQDDRGLELEIVAVVLGESWVVIHVMPTVFRKAHKRWHLK